MRKQLLLLLCSLLAAVNLYAQQSVGYQDSWPKPNGTVFAIARSGNTVYIGGAFTTVGGQSRSNIAAINATTGTLTSWNPGAANDVFCLAVSGNGNTVYAGGAFFSIGGQSRSNLAAIDATTGSVTSWQPDPENNVISLAISGNTVYVGGEFTTIGGANRNRIAAVDATTGNALSWNPNANDQVATLALSGSVIYAGGSFTTIGGQSRNRIAALDATTGLASSWNPNANDRVSSIALSGSTLYVAGNFSAIGGQGRNNIAALSTTTGNATAWNPNPNSTVYSLAVNGSRVYASGEFTAIGGQSRGRIAALDATTGNATPWNPNENSVNAEIRFVAVSGSFVYAGGNFSRMAGDTTRRFFMALLDSTSLPPFVTITASANPVCAGASVTFTAVPFNAISPTYQWTKNSTAISGATATTFTTTTLANGDTIRCVMTDGGTPTASNAITMTVNALPAASISTTGPNPFCPGTTVPLSASPNGAGNSFLWKLGATTLSSTTAQQNATAAGSYTVRITDVNGCVGTSAAFVLTTKSPPAAFNLTANATTTFCAGGSVTLSPNISASTAASFPNYQWSNNGTAISGATSVSFPATASGNYTVAISDNGGCGRTSVARPVTVNPLPAAAISGQNPFCAGSTAVLNASPTGTGITYQWKMGSTVVATTAQYSTTTVGSYTVRVTDANGCAGTSPAFALTKKTPPSGFNLAASGATSFCQGGSVTLSPNASANLSGFPNFQWSNNGTAISGATSSSFPASASGSYTVTVSDSTGCAGTSAARTVTVNPLPTPAISTAQNPFCPSSPAVLNASPGGAGNSYLWKFGSTTISGATAATYATSAAGSYTVTVTDANGCVGTSPAFALTAKPIPAAFNLTANAATTFCSGGSVTLSPNTTAANLSGFPNFQWSNNGVAISGATSSSFPATASGSYTLTASDSTGCGRTSVARVVTVNPTPAATITPLGSTTIGAGGSVTLQANAGTGFTYQWFKNNVAISGATAQNLVATTGGSYTVRVTSGSCFKMSSAVVVTQTGAKESLGVTAGGSDGLLDGYFSFSAFPNPAGDKVMVRTNGALSQAATVQVMSLTGAAVKKVEMRDAQTEIDLSGLAAGVYLLRYKDAEGRTGIIRLVKQ